MGTAFAFRKVFNGKYPGLRCDLLGEWVSQAKREGTLVPNGRLLRRHVLQA